MGVLYCVTALLVPPCRQAALGGEACDAKRLLHNWHWRGKKLQVPPNILLLGLRPYSPELNPMEKV
jgi:hypothetical protein